MKKKVTDLSQALAVGLPVPGRPRSSGVEERGEGCSVRSVSRSTPLKVRIQPDCPPA